MLGLLFTLPLKHRWTSTELHGVTTHMTALFTTTAVRTSNPTPLGEFDYMDRQTIRIRSSRNQILPFAWSRCGLQYIEHESREFEYRTGTEVSPFSVLHCPAMDLYAPSKNPTVCQSLNQNIPKNIIRESWGRELECTNGLNTLLSFVSSQQHGRLESF
jgi:hypothetical protein